MRNILLLFILSIIISSPILCTDKNVSNDSLKVKIEAKSLAREKEEKSSYRDWPYFVLVGLIIAFSQVIVIVVNNRRNTIYNQHKFGYKLLDGLFDDEYAQHFFRLIDFEKSVVIRYFNKDHDCTYDGLTGAMQKAINNDALGGDDEALLYCIDTVLYHFNRFMTAIENKVVTHAILSSSIEYYIPKIKKMKEPLESYIEYIQHQKAGLYLKQWDEWN